MFFKKFHNFVYHIILNSILNRSIINVLKKILSKLGLSTTPLKPNSPWKKICIELKLSNLNITQPCFESTESEVLLGKIKKSHKGISLIFNSSQKAQVKTS